MRAWAKRGSLHELESLKIDQKGRPDSGPLFADAEPLPTVGNGSASAKDRPDSEPNLEIVFRNMPAKPDIEASESLARAVLFEVHPRLACWRQVARQPRPFLIFFPPATRHFDPRGGQ